MQGYWPVMLFQRFASGRARGAMQTSLNLLAVGLGICVFNFTEKYTTQIGQLSATYFRLCFPQLAVVVVHVRTYALVASSSALNQNASGKYHW